MIASTTKPADRTTYILDSHTEAASSFTSHVRVFAYPFTSRFRIVIDLEPEIRIIATQCLYADFLFSSNFEVSVL
jgi:hypothetical protein